MLIFDVKGYEVGECEELGSRIARHEYDGKVDDELCGVNGFLTIFPAISEDDNNADTDGRGRGIAIVALLVLDMVIDCLHNDLDKIEFSSFIKHLLLNVLIILWGMFSSL